MKKLFCILLVLAMMLTLCACEEKKRSREDIPSAENPCYAEDKDLKVDFRLIKVAANDFFVRFYLDPVQDIMFMETSAGVVMMFNREKNEPLCYDDFLDMYCKEYLED